MGVSANLWLNADVDEVVEFLNERFGETRALNDSPMNNLLHVSLASCPDADLSWRHRAETPVGHFPCLMAWRNNSQSLEVLRAVANRFGGMLEENGCDGNVEMVFRQQEA